MKNRGYRFNDGNDGWRVSELSEDYTHYSFWSRGFECLDNSTTLSGVTNQQQSLVKFVRLKMFDISSAE